MPRNPFPSATSCVVVDALILHFLNPILQGRQRVLERFECSQSAGDSESAEMERVVMLFLVKAYRDGLNLLHQAMELGQEREAA